MMMYTSGWPKNQNRCWKRIVSPPPEKSKTEVPKCLSDRRRMIPIRSAGFAKIIIRDPTKRASMKKDLSSLRPLKIGAPMYLYVIT